MQGPNSCRLLFSFTGWREPSEAPGCGRAMLTPRELGLRNGLLTIAPAPEAVQALRSGGVVIGHHAVHGSQLEVQVSWRLAPILLPSQLWCRLMSVQAILVSAPPHSSMRQARSWTAGWNHTGCPLICEPVYERIIGSQGHARSHRARHRRHGQHNRLSLVMRSSNSRLRAPQTTQRALAACGCPCVLIRAACVRMQARTATRQRRYTIVHPVLLAGTHYPDITRPAPAPTVFITALIISSG